MKRRFFPAAVILVIIGIWTVLSHSQQPQGGGAAPQGPISGRAAQTKTPPRYGAISMPRWSPDGGKVAFVYTVGGSSEVYIVDASGKNLVNASAYSGVDTNPVWSPDGRTLIYSSNRGGQFDLCKVDRQGENQVCIDSKGDDLWPAWSPDSRTVAFCNYEKGYPLVYFISPDGKNRERFYKEQACYPAFSSDGKRLALSSKGDIHVFNLKNRKSKNITESLVDGDMVEDTIPVWAPKGNRLAFVGAFEAYSAEVYTIGADGKKVRRITDNLFEDFFPSWDPKGKGVVYSAYVSDRPPEIFVSDPESPEKKRLTFNHTVESSPRYSPDGASILYVSRRWAQDDLYIMGRDGADQRPFLKEALPSVGEMAALRKKELKREEEQKRIQRERKRNK